MANKTFPRMHVSYYVRDINQTVAFYNAFFGQQPSKVKPDYAKYELESPALIISFVQNPERVQAHFGHLGFQVDTLAELNERLAQARQQQLPVLEEMGTNCCYAHQDKFWVTDPDGVQWEVYYFHADAEFNDPHYASQDANACCTPAAQSTINFVFAESEAAACCAPGSGCC